MKKNRAGVDYAETQARGYFRQPSLSDIDRLGICCELTYQILKNLLISASLRHLNTNKLILALSMDH